MKRLAVLAVLAAVVRMSGLLPFPAMEIDELVPVETLTVSAEQGQVQLDAGECRGQGKTWAEALEDLHRGAEGTVFLGTAGQVVLNRKAATLLPQIIQSSALRPGAAVCVCDGEVPSPKEAGAYLSAHNTGVTLQHVQAALVRGEHIALPLLVRTEGGLRLYGTANG